MEKMLRSIPELGRLYLLIRPKKGQSAAERLESELFESPIFERLANEINPSSSNGPERGGKGGGGRLSSAFLAYVRSKIVPVQGDICMEEGLGISSADFAAMQKVGGGVGWVGGCST